MTFVNVMISIVVLAALGTVSKSVLDRERHEMKMEAAGKCKIFAQASGAIGRTFIGWKDCTNGFKQTTILENSAE